MRYPTAERGIRRFLDIGAGPPTRRNVHQAVLLVAIPHFICPDDDPHGIRARLRERHGRWWAASAPPRTGAEGAAGGGVAEGAEVRRSALAVRWLPQAG
ncbi:SAM-dependent methyltransferase [Actinomadura kijaniata]|uniref:SAM-dependent methyltransferase n=1 Tax=Actinomadura kijaniata TaxID=46161 RepID=UPI00082F3327